MAMNGTHRPASYNAGISARLNGVVPAVFAALSNWNDARSTRRQLGKLSAHELADIGLCRGDIELMFS